MNSDINSEEPFPKYLLIDGVIVDEGTETDLVNKAALYDSDYEIQGVGEVSPYLLRDWLNSKS